jgi:hypothetical protein
MRFALQQLIYFLDHIKAIAYTGIGVEAKVGDFAYSQGGTQLGLDKSGGTLQPFHIAF